MLNKRRDKIKSIIKSLRFKEDVIKESKSTIKKYNLNFTQFIINVIKIIKNIKMLLIKVIVLGKIQITLN